MSAPELAGTEGWLVLEPVKHNGRHYPQHAALSRDELDDASAERLIFAGVIEVAEWVDEQLPFDPEPPVVESASPETAAALDAGKAAVTKPSKTQKPSKPAKASQE